MYKITYIHKDETTENTLFIPGDETYCLSESTLTLGVGVAGELSASMPYGNPARDDFVCLTDEVIVYRDDVEIWRGRAVTQQYDFYMTGTLTCEGALAYLYDTYYPPFDFSGSPSDLLADILDNHNSQVEDRKKICLGEITVDDSNDYIARSGIEYKRTITVLSEKFTETTLAGYFRVRVENGVKYLDYLSTYDTTASQPIVYGSNLLDMAQNIEYSSLATVILPLGAKLTDDDGNETDEYLTISKANGGSIYYADEAAVEQYGWIVVCNIWEDVTNADNLVTKAKEYLSQVTSAVASFEISAVDLSLISDDYVAFNVGDYILVQSDAHGVNQYVELTEMTLDLLEPENDMYTFGAAEASLTDSAGDTERNVQVALETLQARFTNLVSTVITTTYLNAHYITADEIQSTYVATENLKATIAEFGYVTVDEIEATLAEIGYLTADSATIVNLSADLANIISLLAGSVGTTTLQAIHITADNTVIDDAVITSAMIKNIVADKITSGTIYTDYVKIANNTGENLLIDGSTIQISDGTTMRVQIGEDASGDYNLYLWNSSGTLIWDAQGLTEAGLTGNGAIIKDAAVADDAAISGYKLDITSVAERLNEDGSITVDAANVTVDSTTLDYKLTTLTTQINTSVAGTTSEYYLSTSPTALSGGSWSSEQPTWTDGMYIWARTLTTYADGRTEYSAAVCITGNTGASGASGTDGTDGISYAIESTNGYIYSAAIDTTLTARIYQGTEEVDSEGALTYDWYIKDSDDADYTYYASGKTITLSVDDTYVSVYFVAGGESSSVYYTDEEGNYLTDENDNLLIA